ncbi:MAG: thiosulfate oxidation carrier protein SoxY [Thiohalomonadales bacterium]
MFVFSISRCFRLVFALTLILLLVACSSDSDTPANNNANNKLSGVFLNIEGIEYSSGGEKAVTGVNGSFSYKKGASVKFFIGDILIGEIPGQAFISTVDLVSGVKDESNVFAVNIYRCLLSLDSDNDFSNGVQIAPSTLSLGIGRSINFNQSEIEFEQSAAVVVAALVESSDPSSVLVSPEITRSELRSSLLELYLGYYAGTFSGSDSGTWFLIVDGNGVITGSGVADSDGSKFSLQGSVDSSGNGVVNAGVVSGGASYTGVFQRNGKFSGTWKNSLTGDAGKFAGNKSNPPDTSGNGGTTDINTGGSITSNPDFLAGGAIFNTVSADFSSFYTNAITIKAPDIAENGAVVPVNITFPSDAGTLWLYIDNNAEKIALKADFLMTSDNGFLSTRVKMEKSGNIVAIFDNGSGSLSAAKKQVKVTIGATLQSCGLPECIIPALTNSAIRVRDKTNATVGTFKMLLGNEMSIEDYITQVSLTVAGVANTVVYFTPYVSKNPYLALYHKAGAGLEVIVKVDATQGRSVTSTIKSN